jgi:hypothetical protein
VLVELGNPVPANVSYACPGVTYLNIPEGYDFNPDTDPHQVMRHLAQKGRVTSLGRDCGHDNEALLAVVHPDGVVANHHTAPPSWVWSDNEAFSLLISRYYDIALGRPADVEDTHQTKFGGPGVGPWAQPVEALLVNSGNDMVSQLLGGNQVGTTGVATGSTSTTLTNSGALWSSNQWAGMRVFAATSGPLMVFGIVVSNTSTALTVDRWYTVATPGATAGTTPSSTGVYVIVDGGGPAWFMGLTANSSAANATDTSLPSEITTSGGGLIRKICPYAHSAGATTYTLTPVFTANSSDSLPVTIAKIGVFPSMVAADVTDTLMLETLLGTTATLSLSGDQLTVTETVTI